ncbi:MAG: hypothetical protein WD426_14960 [Anditalea sp.]
MSVSTLRADPDQVRSSIARRLGMEISGLDPSDRFVDGVVEVMVDAIHLLRIACLWK